MGVWDSFKDTRHFEMDSNWHYTENRKGSLCRWGRGCWARKSHTRKYGRN